MSQTLILVDNVTVKFTGNMLFNSLNFSLSTGEHWAITGKSGSGKSVLLQLLAGNLGVNGGSVIYPLINGIEADEPLNFNQFIAFAGSKHHFKTLSNTSDLYYQQRFNSADSEDALTVRDYLRTVKANQHKPAKWTIDTSIDALNLSHLADKAVIKLSNGETKRLMIAAALVKNPLVLLLDNPMTGLDVNTRAYFNRLFTDIAASGISIVMATSAHEIPDMITNVAVLDDGRIIQSTGRKDFKGGEDLDREPTQINIAELKSLTPAMNAHSYHKIVDMKGVQIRYGDKLILDGINWQISPGERWALLGPNGAGKSTLLSLINGDNPQAYANDIVLFDRKRGSGESIWDIKSKIGFVSPELYQYFPTDNSCLQVIESGFYDTLGLFRASVKSRAELAMRWMKALEIDKYARQLLKNIPASAQRLCLLARALIKSPALLIFDEPCQGLDDHQQRHFKAIVDAICENSSVTLIYVTHYQHEIPESVTKLLKLDKGKVV